MKNRRLNFNTLQQIENFANKELDTPRTFNNKTVILYQEGYRFKWDNAVKRFGLCDVTKRNISLSKPIALLNKDDNRPNIENTILHEIAHALEYVCYGRLSHSRIWKAIHRSIGGNGQTRYGYDVRIPKGKFTGSCPKCGYELQFQKRPTRSYGCIKCSKGRGYDPERKLIITQNY